MGFVRAEIVTKFHAGCLSSKETSRRIARCHCGASRRQPYARSKSEWTDIVSGKSLNFVRFLTAGNKYELDLVEWITLGKKKCAYRRTEHTEAVYRGRHSLVSSMLKGP